MQTGARDDYKFLPIRDAITSINQKVNIIGVILEFGLPSRTRGTDCCCTIKMIDESHQKTEFSVNIFAENSDKLPHVVSGGDIIQLCHVLIKTHGGEVNAVFNKRFSSFALYTGKDCGDLVPYQVSSNFCARDLDTLFVTNLRKWLANFQLDEESSNFLLLREIKEERRVNLACKLVHLCEPTKDGCLAFIWDGTDIPPCCIHSRPEDELDNPLPLQVEKLSLPRDLLCTFPTVGTLLRITFDRGIDKNHLHTLIGKWVKIVNISLEVHAGLWCGRFTRATKLRYTPNGDQAMLKRQRLYDERLSMKWGKMPFWSFPWASSITEVDHERVPFVTLMDVLTHSEDTAKFKIVVRVVAVLPWKAEEIRSPLGIYRLRLTLEDPTARIHAFIYAEDGEKLFGGYPSTEILTRKLNALLGIREGDDDGGAKQDSRNPPWVQFCLKSYYISRNDGQRSRQYRVFDTTIVE